MNSILEKFATDPTINVNQASFGYYIANYVIKEKIQRYNSEAMIPPKLGDVWIKILISIDKQTHRAILDLGQVFLSYQKSYMNYSTLKI